MDMLEQSLDASQDKAGESHGSEGVELVQDGQVTYRVVQVGENADAVSQVISSSAFPTQQAVLQNPFSNGGSPTQEGLSGTEARFTYVPTVTSTDGIAGAEAANIAQVATAGGQFYVMMTPQDVLDSGRHIIPKSGSILTAPPSGAILRPCSRDGRRKVLHNEVERRRRDKINNWIVQLSKQIPECSGDHSKQGQSKGGILAKACDYIQGLRSANSRMADSIKDMEKLSVDVELLRQQCEELKQENSVLRAQLQQHGIIPQESGSSSNS